jgi:hypothetical protein
MHHTEPDQSQLDDGELKCTTLNLIDLNWMMESQIMMSDLRSFEILLRRLVIPD